MRTLILTKPPSGTPVWIRFEPVTLVVAVGCVAFIRSEDFVEWEESL